ncbi:MAG: HNH endonuclease [Fibrobacter sp.]|nr:HNH endonuclease [Fibrobacter sp.]
MENFVVDGQSFFVKEIFPENITIPDCSVKKANKLGKAHGEAKLYFKRKDLMRDFFGKEGFKAKCFILKDDLILFLEALKKEYEYSIFRESRRHKNIGKTKLHKKVDFKHLWKERMEKIRSLTNNAIYFSVTDQIQIKGSRGYVKSKEPGYELIREISMPLISYISVIKVENTKGETLFYWKPFVNYDYFEEKASSLLDYGKKKGKRKNIRVGQGKYRQLLLEECVRCPFTQVSDSAILTASHIKPWRVSSKKEKTDPKNGFILSPLYDKLFDKGYISFTDEKKLLVSKWLSLESQKLLKLDGSQYVKNLPLDDERKRYLEYHRKYVYKG